MKRQTGWGTPNGIPRRILRLIGWDEYMQISSIPYPQELIDKEKDRQIKKLNIGTQNVEVSAGVKE